MDEAKEREKLSERFVEVLATVRNQTSFNFYTALMEIAELHARKQKDYGTEHDPFANVRASEDFSIPAWVGAMLRGNDKVSRIKTYISKGTLANEGVEDAFQDLATYSLIALVLFREAMDGKDQPEEQQ